MGRGAPVSFHMCTNMISYFCFAICYPMSVFSYETTKITCLFNIQTEAIICEPHIAWTCKLRTTYTQNTQHFVFASNHKNRHAHIYLYIIEHIRWHLHTFYRGITFQVSDIYIYICWCVCVYMHTYAHALDAYSFFKCICIRPPFDNASSMLYIHTHIHIHISTIYKPLYLQWLRHQRIYYRGWRYGNTEIRFEVFFRLTCRVSNELGNSRRRKESNKKYIYIVKKREYT